MIVQRDASVIARKTRGTKEKVLWSARLRYERSLMGSLVRNRVRFSWRKFFPMLEKCSKKVGNAKGARFSSTCTWRITRSTRSVSFASNYIVLVFVDRMDIIRGLNRVSNTYSTRQCTRTNRRYFNFQSWSWDCRLCSVSDHCCLVLLTPALSSNYLLFLIIFCSPRKVLSIYTIMHSLLALFLLLLNNIDDNNTSIHPTKQSVPSDSSRLLVPYVPATIWPRDKRNLVSKTKDFLLRNRGGSRVEAVISQRQPRVIRDDSIGSIHDCVIRGHEDKERDHFHRNTRHGHVSLIQTTNLRYRALSPAGT